MTEPTEERLDTAPEPEAEKPKVPEPLSLEAAETVTVQPKGRLEGRTLRMTYPSTRMAIAVRRRALTDEVLWEGVLNAIVEHDLGRDPGTLPTEYIQDIADAWLAALTADAVPPA